MQAAYGCHTAIPAAEADKVRAWDEDALSFRATGQRCDRFDFTDTPGRNIDPVGSDWRIVARIEARKA